LMGDSSPFAGDLPLLLLIHACETTFAFLCHIGAPFACCYEVKGPERPFILKT
jgi:hypothetical protein